MNYNDDSFNYSAAYRNQENDVHPPVYYMLLHTVCYFFKGAGYSAVPGIVLNLILLIFVDILLLYVAAYLLGNRWYGLMAAALWGVSSVGVAHFVDLVILLGQLAAVVKHLLPQVGRHPDRRAEETNAPQKTPDDHEHHNPFKANYRVSLADLSQMQTMSQNFQSIPGVYSVTAPIEMTQTFVEVQQAVTKVGQIVILVLMAVSIITVGSTIRLSVFARRREIEIMKYVGATNHLVTLPFFVEGFIFFLKTFIFVFRNTIG